MHQFVIERGLRVYWLYWLALRQYTLNLYSKGELCRFSINAPPPCWGLCWACQHPACGAWPPSRWSVRTNNSAIIDSMIRKQVLKVHVLYWVNFTTYGVCYSTFQKYYIVWNISHFLFQYFILDYSYFGVYKFLKLLKLNGLYRNCQLDFNYQENWKETTYTLIRRSDLSMCHQYKVFRLS